MQSRLKDCRGEFVLDRAFGMLLGAAALVFAISVLSVIFQGNKLVTIANDLTRTVELAGEVNMVEINEQLRVLSEVAGLDHVSCQIRADYLSGGTRIQFGSEFTLTLSYTAYFGIGGVLRVPIPLEKSVVGRSEQYWKV